MAFPFCWSDRYINHCLVDKNTSTNLLSMSANTTLPVNLDDYVRLTNISHWIYRIWTLLFLPLGLAGNLFALLIFFRWANYLSVYLYFCFLCIVNMCIILTDMTYHYLLPYIVQETIMIKTLLPPACKFIFFLTYFFRYIFIWIIVMINVDRCVYLTQYSRKAMICRQRSAKVICCLLVLFSFLANVHFLIYFNQPIITSLPSNTTCAIDGLLCHCKTTNSNYRYFWRNIWPWYNLTIFALLPLVTMIICCAILIRYIRRTRRDSNVSIVPRNHPNRSIAKTLICLNLLFPVTILPAVLLQLYVNFYPPKACLTIGIFNVLFSVGFAMLFVKNVFAFLIYYSTGKKFRIVFWAMLHCKGASMENRS